MLQPDPEWETERLLARPAREVDAPVLFARYASDPAVAKYMTWTPHRDVSETLAFLRRCESAWRDGTAFPWTLWAKEDGGLVGLLEIRVCGSSVDLGYALVRERWGHGFMSEALRTIVAWALAQPTVFRVWAVCDAENVASARVLERAGMTREGLLRRWIIHPNVSAEPRDAFCYSIVR